MNKIFTIYGDKPVSMIKRLLETVKPIRNLKKETVFGIKPNLVCNSPASSGATTHPGIVEGIIRYLQSQGYANIKILESSWVGDDTKEVFKTCGYEDISEKLNVPLIDLKEDSYVEKRYKNLNIKICKEVFKIDYLINVPLIKGHCQTKITCALKNLKGLIPDSEKRRFHTLGLHKPIAALNNLIKQDLIIADGICPDPYFEEGGQPKKMNMIALAYNPVVMDTFAANTLGYENTDIEYIKLAEKQQDQTSKYETVEIESNKKTDVSVKQVKRKYLKLIDEAGACSACYSNLVAALRILDDEGLTECFVENVCIGQGYKGYPGAVGVGNCTNCCKENLPGCPPKTDEIVSFLKRVF